MKQSTSGNTPIRHFNQSPAQILFARRLKDGMPVNTSKLVMREEWIKTQEQREVALSRKHVAEIEEWSRGTRSHTPLFTGDIVSVQNKVGSSKGKWNLSGLIVEVLPNSSYLIKLDGSGRLTKRIRHDIKKIKTFSENQNNNVSSVKSKIIKTRLV